MSIPLSRLLTLAAGGAILCVGVSVRAANYDIDLSAQWTYGNVDQQNVNIQPQGACGPTATVNSFVYLQNRSGVSLIPDSNQNNIIDLSEQIAVVNILNGLMGNQGAGVTDQHFLEGKILYIGDAGLLGPLSIEARGDFITPPTAPFEYVDSPYVDVVQTIPTWQFLWDQLRQGQDVEVGFTWNGMSEGHWVTADSFHFNDANDNMIIDAGEVAQMDFVDPWGGIQLTGSLAMDLENHMVLTYVGGAAGVGASGTINIIVAESPEPTSLALMGLGALVLCVWRRKA